MTNRNIDDFVQDTIQEIMSRMAPVAEKAGGNRKTPFSLNLKNVYVQETIDFDGKNKAYAIISESMFKQESEACNKLKAVLTMPVNFYKLDVADGMLEDFILKDGKVVAMLRPPYSLQKMNTDEDEDELRLTRMLGTTDD